MTIFVTGAERTGTTVFRELLCSTGYFNADEVLHGTLNNESRFFEFVYRKILEDKSYVFPIYYKQLFYEFISNLELKNSNKVVVDIKYQDYRILNSSYFLTESIPFFVEYLQVTKSPVVHIIRRNKLKIVVSKLISDLTGVWSISNVGDRPNISKSITLNCADVVEKIDFLLNADQTVSGLLATTPNVYKLHYEDMFEDSGVFSKTALSIAESVSADSGFDVVPKLIRVNNLSLKEVVKNFHEIETYLLNTPHHWMIQ